MMQAPQLAAGGIEAVVEEIRPSEEVPRRVQSPGEVGSLAPRIHFRPVRVVRMNGMSQAGFLIDTKDSLLVRRRHLEELVHAPPDFAVGEIGSADAPVRFRIAVADEDKFVELAICR